MERGNDFREVLWRMRDRFGREVFRNPKRMFAILRDLAPGMEAESNVLRQLADRGLLEELERLSELEKLPDSDGGTRRGRVLMRLHTCLTDYLQLSEERAEYYAALLLDLYELPHTLPHRLPAGQTGQLAWTLDEHGTLTVFGSGAMENYVFEADTVNSPWWGRRAEVKAVVVADGVTTVGDSAFYGCAELRTVTLPESVLRIGEWAFADCTRLDGVTLPDTVRRIDRGAFSDCKSLSEIVIPKEVGMLESWTFCNCVRLRRVVIPETVAGIGQRAFQGCTLLSHVRIPPAAWVEENAFEDSVVLTRDTPRDTPEPEDVPAPRWKPILLPDWLNGATYQKFLLALFALVVILRHGLPTLALFMAPVALLLFLERS